MAALKIEFTESLDRQSRSYYKLDRMSIRVIVSTPCGSAPLLLGAVQAVIAQSHFALNCVHNLFFFFFYCSICSLCRFTASGIMYNAQ